MFCAPLIDDSSALADLTLPPRMVELLRSFLHLNDNIGTQRIDEVFSLLSRQHESAPAVAAAVDPLSYSVVAAAVLAGDTSQVRDVAVRLLEEGRSGLIDLDRVTSHAAPSLLVLWWF
jgi:hypothetical protein